MSKYYVVFERPDGDKVLRDGYVFEFEHEYPTEEELMKAMEDVLGGTDKGTIIFMQKLYVSESKELAKLGDALTTGLLEGLAFNLDETKEGEENAEQQ